VRVLAVTGDDFGHSTAVNRAVAEAHDRGVLTSASLIVSGEAASEAIRFARSRPSLSVGLHLVLVDGRAVLARQEIPSLVDSGRRFPSSPTRAGVRYFFSARAQCDLRREIRAQLERFQDSGLPLSHVDGHHHLHLHPTVLRILTELAEEFAIPSVRLPSEELGLALRLDPRGRPGKLLSAIVFALLRRHGRRLLEVSGIGFRDRVYGLLATGHITEKYLLELLPRIRGDRVEIYCHPSAPPADESRKPARAAGDAELAALLSLRVAEAIKHSGFTLSRAGPAASVLAPMRSPVPG